MISDLFYELDWFTLGSLVVLLLMSILSWSILIAKYLTCRKIDQQTSKFLNQMEGEIRFSELMSLAEKKNNFPAQKLFLFSAQDLNRLKKNYSQESIPKTLAEESLQRSFELIFSKFSRDVYRGFSLLASVSNSAPFVGLFGTVTGVLRTLYRLGGETGALGFNRISPSLSIALVATAFGLFVAIPASVGYNLLKSRVENLQSLLQEVKVNIEKRILS